MDKVEINLGMNKASNVPGQNHLIGIPMMHTLRIYGFWPQERFDIGAIMVALAIIVDVPFEFAYAWNLRGDTVLMMDCLREFFSVVMIIIKYFLMWGSRRDIADLIQDVLRDWRAGALNSDWERFAYYSRTFCAVDLAAFFIGTGLYYPTFLISNSGKPEGSKSNFLKAIYPRKFRFSPFYELVIIAQIIECNVLGIAESMSRTLLTTLVLHTSARVSTLKSHLQEFSKRCTKPFDSHDRRYIMNQIVKEHQYIRSFVKKIDNIYSNVSFFTVVFNNVILCASGFVIITAAGSVDTVMMAGFILFIIWIISQAFIFCALGEYTSKNGEAIVEALYEVPWYNIEPKEIKTLVVVLANAQQPLVLSGGKIFSLTHNSFLKFVKSSFSYMSVLRVVYSD